MKKKDRFRITINTYLEEQKERTGYSMKNKRKDNSGPNRIEKGQGTAPASADKAQQRLRRMRGRIGRLRRNSVAGVVTAASLLIFIALLPYADIKEYLVPANYKAMLENGYAQMSQAAADEWRSSGIREMNLAHDGTQRLTVIANEWDETTQFIEYEAVPQPIDRILNVPAVEEGKLSDTIDDYLESYLYVARGSKASYVGNWQETAEFTEDNMPLLEGTLYRVNRLNDVKTLTPVHRNIGDFSY